MTAEVSTTKEKEIKIIEEEAGEMTWLLKFLPCKYEDLTLDSWHPHKNPGADSMYL